MALETLFRKDAVDRIESYCGEKGKDAFPAAADDRIASFFFGPAFDLIARTAFIVKRFAPEGKRDFASSVQEFFPLDDVNFQSLVRKFVDEEKPLGIAGENYVFLEMLRANYRAKIRGATERCWENLDRVIEEGGAGCGEFLECHGSEGGLLNMSVGLQCEEYQISWRTTSLALETAGAAPAAPDEVRRLLYASCPILEETTDSDLLEGYLRELCGTGKEEERRSLRGLAVRILTALVNFCLEDLSRRLELPPKGGYFFYA